MTKKNKHRRRGCVFPLIFLLFCIASALYIYWDNNAVVTNDFVFESDALPPGFDGFKIVQISDVHNHQFGADSSLLLNAVEDAAPDIIVITGDLMDEYGSLDDISALSAALPAIAPTYYITGNHEWAAKCVEDVISLLTDDGITCLQNEYVTIENGGESIVLAGIHDPNGRADQKTPAQLAGEIYAEKGDPFWILLAHRNTLYEEYGTIGADLLITGHAHGGIIRLPGTDGLLSTNRTLFPKWTSGFYYDYDTPMFVSRGLGNIRPTFRIFNPPQLAVLELKRKE